MKKLLRLLLLIAALTAALCVNAMAADLPTKTGMYGIQSTGAALTPQTADKTEITATTQGEYNGYYVDAERFDVTAEQLTPNKQYMLYVLKEPQGVPTANNIVYIDQQAANADGKVSFNAYPSSLTKGHYRVYVVGEGKEFNSDNPTAQFDYYQPYTLGDVNGDGKIIVNDAQMVLNCAVGNLKLTETQFLAADVVHDGKVLVNDAQKILNYIVGNITDFD